MDKYSVFLSVNYIDDRYIGEADKMRKDRRKKVKNRKRKGAKNEEN